jgi:hypothetical protein
MKKNRKTIIIAVESDNRGGAIYSKPDPQQEENIRRILEKANKELEEMAEKEND